MASRLSLSLLCAVLLVSSAVEGDHGPLSLSLPSTPTRNVSEYRLRYRHPHGCDPDSCDYFVGIDTNEGDPSFLDFYLVGKTGGWVALGLTKTANMFKADVLGCSIDAANKTWVVVVDTHNPPSPDRYNGLDDSEINTGGEPSDVVVYMREYIDGNIRCVFSRSIEGVDPGPQDLLLNESFYLLFGTGNEGRDSGNITALSYHDKTPRISQKRYNPARDSGDIGISTLKEKLITAHGALMLIAWPLLSFTAIFFAAWMKPALPNGQWFQVHRAFNLASVLVAVAGLVLVFVSQKDQSPPGLIDLGTVNKIGTAHFALGIVIMALHLINPLISFCRCKPDEKYRWVFILLHGIIVGYGVQTLAYANVGIGVSIYSRKQTDFGDLTLLWVYVAAAVFSVLLALVFFVVFTAEAVISKRNARDIAPTVLRTLWQWSHKYSELKSSELEMQYSVSDQPVSTTTDLITPPAHKLPSRDAPLRWLGLVVFLLVMSAAVITLIVLMIVRSNSY